MSWRRIALAALLTVTSVTTGVGSAVAHETTRSFVTLDRDGQDVETLLRVAFRDIEVVAWMDENLDGSITWGETRRRLDAVETYVRAGFSLEAGGVCDLTRVGADASSSGGIEYLDLRFQARCPSADAPLTARSRLFTEIDPAHRMFLQASVDQETTTTVLSAAEPSVEFRGDASGRVASFLSYFRSGVEHLMAGPDHLVFLLVLMLPAVCAQGGARKAALGVLTAVTGFTLAHALTLSAATTELLRPPATLIEILIPLSIVITAADNIRPFIPAPRAAVAAFFGLVHGFGFASALGALQLTGSGLAVALLGFNLGIEAAQVGVVLAAMPALYMLSGGRLLLRAGSAAAIAVGLWWLAIRFAPFAPAG
ncbi:MAG: HupE/UreJ family protein [Rhodobacteraceae bacterium]|nr:HupE/UreJ family protein [Paracoccaceae bacterium]